MSDKLSDELPISTGGVIQFDLDRVKKLRVEYEAAVASGQDHFVFEGQYELLTRYGFYLLEYLDRIVPK